VASGPSDIGNLPGNNGDELQGLALELRDSAQINLRKGRSSSYFIFNFAMIASDLSSF